MLGMKVVVGMEVVGGLWIVYVCLVGGRKVVL
jgi:hypothetical protein